MSDMWLAMFISVLLLLLTLVISVALCRFGQCTMVKNLRGQQQGVYGKQREYYRERTISLEIITHNVFLEMAELGTSNKEHSTELTIVSSMSEWSIHANGHDSSQNEEIKPLRNQDVEGMLQKRMTRYDVLQKFEYLVLKKSKIITFEGTTFQHSLHSAGKI